MPLESCEEDIRGEFWTENSSVQAADSLYSVYSRTNSLM